MTQFTTPVYQLPYCDDDEPANQWPGIQKRVSERIEQAFKDAQIPPGDPSQNAVLTRLAALEKQGQGLVLRRDQTGQTGQITGQAVVDNVPTFTFKAARNYRVTWQANFYTGDASSTFIFGLSRAAVSDPAGQTSGMTGIKNTADRPTVGQEGRQVIVMGYLKFTTETTVQLKVWAQRASGGSYLVLSATPDNPNSIIVEDLGSLI
ncbi:MAG: hypothetical protein L0G87_00960 [Renibacterium salmoninarum]|nr:hypothetical protein [Renibacterium salmoninarum]